MFCWISGTNYVKDISPKKISSNASGAVYNVVDLSLHSSFSLTGKVARANITYLEIQWTNRIVFDFAKVLLKNPGKLPF